MQTANKEEIRKAQLVIVPGLLLLYFSAYFFLYETPLSAQQAMFLVQFRVL